MTFKIGQIVRDDLTGKTVTIERINTNGDYEPQNTKWDTYKNQQRNKG